MRGEVNSLNKIAVSTPPGCFSRASALHPSPVPPPRYSSHSALSGSVSVASSVSSYVLNAIDDHLNKLHVDSVIMMIKFLSFVPRSNILSPREVSAHTYLIATAY